MARDDYRHLKRDEQETQKKTRSCAPLGLIMSSLGSFSRCWCSAEDGQAPAPVEKKYVHTPTHAASSYLKTTTTRNMQKANEIL